MKKVFLLTLALVCTNMMLAQNSEKAKALLDDVYNKVNGYENIYVDFKYVLNNTEADITCLLYTSPSPRDRG